MREGNTAGHLWAAVAPACEQGLASPVCVCAMLASFVIQDFHNLLLSLPLV